MKEIERKFFVKDNSWRDKTSIKYSIKQGYLSDDINCTVRVRIQDEVAYITVKGPTSGISRSEFEYKIPYIEAIDMMQLCPNILSKTRYLVNSKDRTFEVDEFHGNNEGLIIAEVELEYEDQYFDKPDWLGEETFDPKYFNSNLIKNPYSNFKE